MRINITNYPIQAPATSFSVRNMGLAGWPLSVCGPICANFTHKAKAGPAG